MFFRVYLQSDSNTKRGFDHVTGGPKEGEAVWFNPSSGIIIQDDLNGDRRAFHINQIPGNNFQVYFFQRKFQEISGYPAENLVVENNDLFILPQMELERISALVPSIEVEKGEVLPAEPEPEPAKEELPAAPEPEPAKDIVREPKDPPPKKKGKR